MPAKNVLKHYVANSYYHLYNRGVEKRTIFRDAQDYAVFLSYLKTYLLPKDTKSLEGILASLESSSKEKAEAQKLLRMNNFADSFTLMCFCLLANHFHLLVWQKGEDVIDRFMNSFGTRYSMYFNSKYRRVGPLFQGLYKAVRVETDEQLLHLSRYIHRNPASKGTSLRSYSYSSYPYYLAEMKAEWVHQLPILSYFHKTGRRGYQEFVESSDDEDASFSIVAPVAIDADV